VRHSHSSLKQYANCPLAYYHERIMQDTPRMENAAATWGKDVHRHFELRTAQGTALPTNLKTFEQILAKFDGLPTRAEWQLAIDADLKPTEWESPTAWFRGIIDLYVSIDAATALVLDYKTGKRRMDNDQLEACALLLFAHDPTLRVVRAGFLWTQLAQIDSCVYDRANINAMWAHLMARIRPVHKSHETDVWPARPSGLCGWCAHQPNCPQGKR